jgi:predicted nuclease with TOPRIM domain
VLERTRELEASVAALEARLRELEGEIARASEAHDAQAVWQLGEEYRQVEESLRRRLDEWMTIAKQV